MDPKITVKPTDGQIDDLISEINLRVEKGERVLVTTLTKKMAEDLTGYLEGYGIKVRYMHHDIDTVERMEIIRDLRLGEFDVLVGINLLREGLDIPEVSLVAILDADKEGFLRSGRSLIQTIGRAARNAQGQVIMYADEVTPSMEQAITRRSAAGPSRRSITRTTASPPDHPQGRGGHHRDLLPQGGREEKEEALHRRRAPGADPEVHQEMKPRPSCWSSSTPPISGTRSRSWRQRPPAGEEAPAAQALRERGKQMELRVRRAEPSDLPAVKEMYAALVARMDQEGWGVWDETYPRDFVEKDIERGQFYLLLEGSVWRGFALPPTTTGRGRACRGLLPGPLPVPVRHRCGVRRPGSGQAGAGAYR